MVKNRTKRSDQAIALRRRSARMRRIDRLRSVAEMVQNPLDDCGFLDTGDHPQLPGDIFDAMKRKEIYATTGSRIRVRVFRGLELRSR